VPNPHACSMVLITALLFVENGLYGILERWIACKIRLKQSLQVHGLSSSNSVIDGGVPACQSIVPGK